MTHRLVADIGGTNARFAMLDAKGLPTDPVTIPCDDHANFPAALQHYLTTENIGTVDHIAMAIATPITGDQVTLTNRPDWSFSQKQLKDTFTLTTLNVLNDYTALALSISHLTDEQVQQVGPKLSPTTGAIGLIGPGTGLGVSGLVPTFDNEGRVLQYGVVKGEGGHVTLGVMTEREQAVYKVFELKYGHVSAERIVSGPGMAELYQVLQKLDGIEPEVLAPAEVSKRAMEGSCKVCVETLEMFCALFGSCAGNLALTLGATGGIYIGGGITPKLGQFFHDSDFRKRFEAKGRMSALLKKMPTYVITAPYPALLGCAKSFEL